MRSEGRSGELEAQRRALAAACKRRGWQLLEAVEEAGLSAEDLKRPGIEEALRALERADAQALVAAKRELLSQALPDLACLLASAQQQCWPAYWRALSSSAGRSSRSTAPSNRRRPPGSRSRTCSPPSPSASGA